MTHCPMCNATTKGFFYLGSPGWCCDRHPAPVAGGLSAWLASILFFGAAIIYERGAYWRTLWNWLLGRYSEE